LEGGIRDFLKKGWSSQAKQNLSREGKREGSQRGAMIPANGSERGGFSFNAKKEADEGKVPSHTISF